MTPLFRRTYVFREIIEIGDTALVIALLPIHSEFVDVHNYAMLDFY